MILLFTAVDAKRPYHKRDLLNVCCEARGAPIRFGYRKRWISTNVPQGKLTGCQALIVFTEVLIDVDTFRFHPVRLADITRSTDEYDAIALDLELGEFANYERDTAQINAFLQRFAQYVDQSDRPQPKTTDKPSFYVRSETDFDPKGFGGNWTSLVDHMRQREGLRDATFIASAGADGTSTLPAPLLDGCVYRNGRATYEVTSGQTREIALRLVPGAAAKTTLPELIIKDAVASASGPFVRQHSSGFEGRFVLAFARAFQEETAMLSVRMPLDRTDESIAFVSPELDALVRLKVSRFTLWVAIILLVVGSVVQSFTPEQIERASWLPWPLLKMVGALMMAAGAFLGFRKLPFKS
jgi:hypothetical protein